MRIIGNCSLCDSSGVHLHNSHIIPEWCYEKVYANDHTIKPISINGKRYRIEQNGFREHLLCAVCEQLLSVWENELCKLFRGLSSNPVEHVSVSSVPGVNIELVENVNYTHVKLAILSIFWRMSLAKAVFFKNYQLGEYGNKIKTLLVNNNAMSADIYPVMISKFFISGEFLNSIMAMQTRGKYANRISQISVILYGFVIDVFLNDGKHTIPNKLRLFCLS